jgi:drug/metabolite transporter (DMT)-like permease
MPTILLVFIVTLLTIGSQLALKAAIGQVAAVLSERGALAFIWAAMTSLGVLLAVSMQGIGFIVWWFVITQERLSVAFAISGSFFYLVMALASWLIYDEKLNLQQVIGLVLITAGVLMVNLNKPT